MARLIDADAMLEYLNLMYDKQNDSNEPFNCAVLGAINYIKHKAPTIDAVEVVRCKECKWAKANGTYQWCGRLDSTARITADAFCSYGERKGE